MIKLKHAAVEILADDPGRVAPAIEDRTDLILQQRALLLDDDDEVEPLGECAHDDRIERPDHADLEKSQAERPSSSSAKIAQRLQEILPRLAGSHDADARAGRIADDPVELVRARVGECSGELVFV